MTDYAKLESELRRAQSSKNIARLTHAAADALAQAVRERDEAVQALSAPGDAEREELAQFIHDHINDGFYALVEVTRYQRIRDILRRPVAPVVTEVGKSDLPKRSKMQLATALELVLEASWWPGTLKQREVYTRQQDDHDGDRSQVINVMFGHDGDAFVQTLHYSMLRFRNAFVGGGQSPRVRNALIVLAEAIRRDNEERPQAALSQPAGGGK